MRGKRRLRAEVRSAIMSPAPSVAPRCSQNLPSLHIYIRTTSCVHRRERRERRGTAIQDDGHVAGRRGGGVVGNGSLFFVRLCAFVTWVDISMQKCLFSLLGLALCVLRVCACASPDSCAHVGMRVVCVRSFPKNPFGPPSAADVAPPPVLQ